MPCTAPSLRYFTGLVRVALTERFWLVLLWALPRPHDRAQQSRGASPESRHSCAEHSTGVMSSSPQEETNPRCYG